jgi:anti-sigma factor RsiW
LDAAFPVDPEELSALLDGGLSDAKRAMVRARLAAADVQTIVAYEDAVAIVVEMTSGPIKANGACP